MDRDPPGSKKAVAADRNSPGSKKAAADRNSPGSRKAAADRDSPGSKRGRVPVLGIRLRRGIFLLYEMLRRMRDDGVLANKPLWMDGWFLSSQQPTYPQRCSIPTEQDYGECGRGEGVQRGVGRGERHMSAINLSRGEGRGRGRGGVHSTCGHITIRLSDHCFG